MKITIFQWNEWQQIPQLTSRSAKRPQKRSSRSQGAYIWPENRHFKASCHQFCRSCEHELKKGRGSLKGFWNELSIQLPFNGRSSSENAENPDEWSKTLAAARPRIKKRASLKKKKKKTQKNQQKTSVYSRNQWKAFISSGYVHHRTFKPVEQMHTNIAQNTDVRLSKKRFTFVCFWLKGTDQIERTQSWIN